MADAGRGKRAGGRTNPADTSNIPADVLDQIREQEKEQTKTGLLGGLVTDDPDRPKPQPERHVSDIRMGHGYT